MNVAIMGAGISGLSCAITLERFGIEPMIFEKRNCVGDRFINAESMFSILNRPVNDCIPYLAKNFHIFLLPTSKVDKIFIHSKNEVGSIDGKIGYTNIRGRHEDSYENQLAKQVKTKITMNSSYEYKYLCKDFEHVVVSTGDGAYASQVGNYRCDLTCTIKGVTVEGEFITSNPHVWFNYEILPKGYGWLIPYSEKEANLVIVYPDNMKLDINETWEKFYDLACKNLDQNLKITDSFQIRNYMIGICKQPKINQSYFLGNCFGSIAPGLGFGQFTSILTGVYSAYDICGIATYEELTKPLIQNYNESLIFRRFLENLSDEQFDFHVKNLNNIILGKISGKACSKSSSIDYLHLATPFMKLWNNYKEYKRLPR